MEATVLGWMAVAEAIAYLFLPDVFVARLIGTFNTATWYFLAGVLAIGVGLYLAGFGFNWWTKRTGTAEPPCSFN